MTVRAARIEDLPAIVEIYNHAIETSVATFDLKPFTVEERREWFSLFGSEHPLLVCVNDQNVIQGFAYYLPYRPKAGYARTKETTIYVAELYRRTGVATALYEELIRRARENGVHVLMAVLSGNNPSSQGLHEKLGFKFIARLPEVGRKFDRWIDTHLYHMLLQ